jgi:hypothetical protein
MLKVAGQQRGAARLGWSTAATSDADSRFDLVSDPLLQPAAIDIAEIRKEPIHAFLFITMLPLR